MGRYFPFILSSEFLHILSKSQWPPAGVLYNYPKTEICLLVCVYLYTIPIIFTHVNLHIRTRKKKLFFSLKMDKDLKSYGCTSSFPNLNLSLAAYLKRLKYWKQPLLETYSMTSSMTEVILFIDPSLQLVQETSTEDRPSWATQEIFSQQTSPS